MTFSRDSFAKRDFPFLNTEMIYRDRSMVENINVIDVDKCMDDNDISRWIDENKNMFDGSSFNIVITSEKSLLSRETGSWLRKHDIHSNKVIVLEKENRIPRTHLKYINKLSKNNKINFIGMDPSSLNM